MKLASAPAAKTTAETERRQITVIFYDLVGSTALSNSVEPEDFREAISNFHAVASEAVRPYDAFVGAHVGDGGILYLGYPVAREDAAECAILSGLALIEAVSKITLPDGRKAAARVGIATGTSVVGRIEEGDTGNSAVGQVTSLAARLQSLAKPGQCVIAERTRKLVGELFQLEDLGLLEAKGFAADVNAFAVVGRSGKDRYLALRSGSPKLVGREEQKQELRKRWEETLQGNGQACMVIGEAGVGKSRLVTDFMDSLDRDEVFLLPCSCAPHSQQSALRPFINRFRWVAGARDHQTPPCQETFNKSFAPETTPLDWHLISRTIDLETPEPEEVKSMTSNQLRIATIDAMVRQFLLLAKHRPVVLLIEDMHWADPSSRDLVHKITSAGNLGRAMIILTSRPEIEELWDFEGGVDRIDLPPLSEEESHLLINQVLGAEASPSLVRAIAERAGGIALFVEELTRGVKEADAQGASDTARGLDLQTNFTLPETLQDSLLARLDQLGEAKRIAQIASVVGREFTPQDLVKVAPDLSPLIERGCQKLHSSGLTVRLADESNQFQFRHVLIQEIAYSTLVRGERREYNARLLEALEQDDTADTPIDAERWAHYAMEADQPARAIHYWTLAGQDAISLFAMKEAEARLRRGQELINQVGDPHERARLELDLLLSLGKVLLSQVGHANPETGRVFERAKFLAEQSGDRAKLLASMHGLQAYDLQLSRIQATQERGDEMLRLAQDFDDDAWRLIGYRSRGIASFPLGDYRQCADDLETGIDLLQRTGASFARDLVADDLLAAMQIYASWGLLYLGETRRGRTLFDAALERAIEIRQPYTRAFAMVGRNYCRLMLGEFEGLEEDFNECIALCEEHEIYYFLLTERVHLAHLRALQGAADGAQQLHQAIEGYRQTGSIVYQPTYKHWEGLAWLAQGDLAKAREANEWSIETAHQYSMNHMMTEYYGLKAVLDHNQGRPEDALEAGALSKKWASEQSAVLSEKLILQLWENHEFSNMLVV